MDDGSFSNLFLSPSAKLAAIWQRVARHGAGNPDALDSLRVATMTIF